jgi:hypothetical protein
MTFSYSALRCLISAICLICDDIELRRQSGVYVERGHVLPAVD